MPSKNEKCVTIKSISNAVAEKLGARKTEVLLVVQEVFPELFKQLQEVGLVKIPHFGKFRYKIPIRSGRPKPVIIFRQSPTWSKWAKASIRDPKYQPFIEQIVERDTEEHTLGEERRCRRIAWIKELREKAWNRERVRIATQLGQLLGQEIDPATIPQEALTPPRIKYIRLPDRPVGLREMLEASGVLPSTAPPAPVGPPDASQ